MHALNTLQPETVTLVNASTHTLEFALGHYDRRYRFKVEPLKAVEVLKEWTAPNLDTLGQPKLRSTIEQYAPHLRPEGHPDLAKARQALTNARLAAEGKPLPENALHKHVEWPPPPAQPRFVQVQD